MRELTYIGINPYVRADAIARIINSCYQQYAISGQVVIFHLLKSAKMAGKKIGLKKKISLNNEKLCDILCIGSKTFHIRYAEKEKKETKTYFI